MRYTFTEEEKQNFIDVCNNNATMAQAASKLGMHFNTFKRLAIKFGCYVPNQGGKGTVRGESPLRYDTQDILNGLYPEYSTYKLKCRLIREHILKDECSICGWNKKRENEEFTPCELHHKDGNRFNHSLDNLVLLCPNCHSLTDNYRARNKAQHCAGVPE